MDTVETIPSVTDAGRLDRLEIQVREIVRHVAEMHRCLARLQQQVAALERGGAERRPVGGAWKGGRD